jgi:hypothetical protein
MNAEEIAAEISKLNALELVKLRDILLKDMRWPTGGAGVREPRRPILPLDAEGVALDAERGKASL